MFFKHKLNIIKMLIISLKKNGIKPVEVPLLYLL